jgi:hypothetical protein
MLGFWPCWLLLLLLLRLLRVNDLLDGCGCDRGNGRCRLGPCKRLRNSEPPRLNGLEQSATLPSCLCGVKLHCYGALHLLMLQLLRRTWQGGQGGHAGRAGCRCCQGEQQQVAATAACCAARAVLRAQHFEGKACRQ